MQTQITDCLYLFVKGRDLFIRIYCKGKLWLEGDFYTSYYNSIIKLERSENHREAIANLKEAKKFLLTKRN